MWRIHHTGPCEWGVTTEIMNEIRMSTLIWTTADTTVRSAVTENESILSNKLD